MTPKIPGLLVLLLAACGCGAAQRPPPQAGAPPPDTSVSPPGADPVGQSPEVRPRAVRSTPIAGQILALESLFAATPRGSPDRPKLLRRLAEGYVAMEKAALAEGGRGEAIAREARGKAIDRYALLAAEYPAFCLGAGKGCGDEVLFYLGYEYEQAHDFDKARAAYQQIIKSFPASRYVPNAYLAFAEGFFEEAARDPSKLGLAERAYQAVLKVPPPDNKVAGYAHYKLAYVYFNRGDTARALSEMTRAIEVLDRFPDPPSSALLAREARRDLAPIYAAGGDPTRAYDFFMKRSGDKPGETDKLSAMLDALAHAYADQGKEDAAVDLYVDWLSRGAGAKTCAVVSGIDARLARASGGTLARMQQIAAASAPLMKARVECAAAP